MVNFLVRVFFNLKLKNLKFLNSRFFVPGVVAAIIFVYQISGFGYREIETEKLKYCNVSFRFSLKQKLFDVY